MIVYTIRRILQAIPLLLGAAIVVFGLIHFAPGDPIVALAGEDGDAEYYAMMRERFGLDRPIHERLLIYLGQLARGNFGFSYRFNRPAIEVVLESLPNTLILMIPALLIAIVLGITLGTWAASRPRSATDTVISVGALLGHTVPVFWLAQILLIVLAFRFDLFPVQGMSDARARYTGWRYWVDVAHHAILPVSALAVQYIAPIARVTRTSLVETMGQPFITVAASKGLTHRFVLWRHGLPNTMLPVVTIIGGQVGFMFAGAVLTETVFAWPGLGRLLLNAMLNRDYAIIMTMFLLIATAIIVANLITDLIYSYLDPRVTYE